MDGLLTRRGFLSGVLAAAIAPALSALARPAAASELNRFRVAQVTTGGRPAIRTSAALVLGQEVRFRTAVDVRLDRISVPLGSRAIFELPFLLWVEEEDFPELDHREIANLATFVESGGFLLVDNAAEGPGLAAVDRRFRAELRRALPSRPLVPVPQTHVLLRSFYKLGSVAGRRALRSFVEGAFVEDRIGLVYSQNDLTGAWSRDAYGSWEF
jgi:hypothetical protein